MLADRDRLELTGELVVASRLGASDLRKPAGLGAAAVAPRAALPEPGDPGALDALLRRRTSVRTWARTPLAQEEVRTVVRAAGDADARLWPGEAAAGQGLELLLVAWRVAGLAPGLYAGLGLERAGELPTGPAAQELVLQVEYAEAPALVLVLGDLAAAEARHGCHGHRLALLRAGAAAHAGWLAALGAGLVGGVFAGLLPGPLRGLAGVDGASRAQLFALAIGHAVPDQASPPEENA